MPGLLLAAGIARAQDARAQDARAQDSALLAPGENFSGPQRVRGEVMRPGDTKMLPVPGIRVTLHRVGTDNAAPLDSVVSDSRGRYEFRFRRTGEEGAIYFVSASYGGVAYFTPPLAHATTTGPEAEIAVFDTTSGHVPISVRGRHLIVSAADVNGLRTVTEVFELANDSSVTRVTTAGANGASWSTGIPAGATSFQVSQGDVPAAAMKFGNGRAQLYAPLAPGLKQVAFNYSLPAAAFPLSVPVEKGTQILEVLIEDEKGTVNGATLKEVAPVALERRSFRRFLTADVDANGMFVIDLPSAAVRRELDPRYMVGLTVVIGAAMTVALARALRRR